MARELLLTLHHHPSGMLCTGLAADDPFLASVSLLWAVATDSLAHLDMETLKNHAGQTAWITYSMVLLVLLVLNTLEYPTRPHTTLNPHVSVEHSPLSVAFRGTFAKRPAQYFSINYSNYPDISPRCTLSWRSPPNRLLTAIGYHICLLPALWPAVIGRYFAFTFAIDFAMVMSPQAASGLDSVSASRRKNKAQIQHWLHHPCLLGGPKLGRMATSPVPSRGPHGGEKST